MHVTLQDVAKLAGVSTKTVSRVVNNQGEISEATRQRVQAAIDQLDYRPNILARSLVNQRTNTLAVVAWGLDYYGPSRTVVGIENKSDELGYSLFLNLLAHPDEGDIDRILDTLVARRVEGIIWAVPEVGGNRMWINPDRLDRLPPITFLSMAGQTGLATVAVDNRAGARQAVQHLVDQGRRRIGLITGPLAWWEARERFAGWQEAVRQAGLEASSSLSWKVTGRQPAGRRLCAFCWSGNPILTRSLCAAIRWRLARWAWHTRSGGACRRIWRWPVLTTSPNRLTSGRP
jgi:LacI family transcriptional regulator